MVPTLDELLAEASSAILHELRRRNEFSPKFEFSEFFELRRLNDLLEYAGERLEKLGEGSSRVAFILNSRRTLKVAKNVKGRAQNKTESEVSSSSRFGHLLARVFAFDSETSSWLISDLVRPLKSSEEFRQLTGISFYTMTDVIDASFADGDELSSTLLRFAVHDTTQKKFLVDLVRMIEEMQLDASELEDWEHWGKTPDGRIVILDYGLDDWTREQYYE